MKKMNKFLKGLCLGIGVISLVGLTNVPALANSDTSSNSDKPSYLSQEEWDEVCKAAEEKNKNIHTDLLIPAEKETFPQDGDAKKLNIGWSNTTTGIYYCKDESRVKVTGWQQIDNKWYYFDPSTYAMKEGWFNDNNKWYYLTEPIYLGEGKATIKNGLGSMQLGWIKINGKWYYFNSDGSMKIGWLNDGDKRYYLLEATHVNKNYLNPKEGLLGRMQTGLLRDNDKIYYFNESGVMQTGWVQDNGKWYYFDQSGYMEHNTIVDGYYIDSNGIAVATTSGDMPIKIPSNWKKVDNAQKIMYAIDNKVPFIYTYTDTFGLSESKFVDGMTSEVTKGVTGLSEVQVTEKNYTGKKATCVQFSYKLNSRTIKVRNLIFFKDNKAYCFSLASEVDDFDNAIQQLDDILNCSLVL